MDNLVSINHTKKNSIEFDLTTEGVETNDIVVKLVIEAKGMEIGFTCTNKKGDTWVADLPPLPMLERTAYKFHVDVHADGYHFEPMKGTVNVVGSAEVYTSEPKNTTISPDGKDEKKATPAKKEEKKVQESWRKGEKPIAQIARELMEGQKYSKEQIEAKVEEIHEKADAKTLHNSKDEKVLEILKEVGITPKAEKKRARISFFNS